MGGGASILHENQDEKIHPSLDLNELIHVSWEDALNMVEPFDLFLFQGVWNISKFICLEEKIVSGHGEWSHVGIIVTTDVLPIQNGIPGRKYIWEANTTTGNEDESEEPDIELGQGTNSVQIRDFENVLKKRPLDLHGETAIAKLRYNPWKLSKDKPDYRNMLLELMKSYKELVGRIPFTSVSKIPSGTVKYLMNPREYKDTREFITDKLFIPQLPSPEKIPKELFCSAFVTLTLQTLGVLPNTIDPELVFPCDFTSPYLKESPLDVIETPIMIDWRTVYNIPIAEATLEENADENLVEAEAFAVAAVVDDENQQNKPSGEIFG